MPTTKNEALKENFGFTAWLIHKHVEGITDAESLLQLPFAANCLNWIVGHIVSQRNMALEVLGQPPVWDETTQARYQTGSAPIRDGGDARPLAQLLEDLDRTQQCLAAALGSIAEADLERMVENMWGVKTAAEHLTGFHWHETYHTGQLDILNAFIAAQRIPAA